MPLDERAVESIYANNLPRSRLPRSCARRAWGQQPHGHRLQSLTDASRAGTCGRHVRQARAAEHLGGHGTVDTDGEDEGWELRAEALPRILRTCEFSRTAQLGLLWARSLRTCEFSRAHV